MSAVREAELAEYLAAFSGTADGLFSPVSLLWSALVLFAVTFLFSRLPCGWALVLALTGCKGFCTAFCLGVLLRFLPSEAALFRLHSLLLLPVWCGLCFSCCAAVPDCGRFFTDRRRTPATVLPLLCLLLTAVAEQLLWRRF